MVGNLFTAHVQHGQECAKTQNCEQSHPLFIRVSLVRHCFSFSFPSKASGSLIPKEFRFTALGEGNGSMTGSQMTSF
jgi:hypothetical protein